jgi:hypothetical protein
MYRVESDWSGDFCCTVTKLECVLWQTYFFIDPINFGRLQLLHSLPNLEFVKGC